MIAQRLQYSCALFIAGILIFPVLVFAQANPPEDEAEQQPPLQAVIGSARSTLVDKPITFDTTLSVVPEATQIQEVLWDFGDGIRTTGDKVTHTYQQSGIYQVKLTITADQGQSEDTTEVRVFDRVVVLLADASASEDQLQLSQQQAAEQGLLLLVLKARSSGPEVLIEEELTQQLLDARNELAQAHLVVAWTSGGVGPNVLSKFAQHLRQQTANLSATDLSIESKGIIILSETRLGVLSRTAQSVFGLLHPAYVLLTRPEALGLLYSTTTADQAHTIIFESPIEHRLLGTFSERAVSDLGITNFMSFGLNFLVNRGVPINNIILILMLPVIATILSFARQVIGIKAFGLITPAMTTLSFLVMGLQYGLAVFIVVLLSGTLTRVLLRRLRMLYLPRMALVLTNASLAILVLLGFGVVTERAATLSFSIFPILILTILAEEFIAVQFKAGARTALTTTAWTLFLSIACYFIVSWQLLRTFLLSYPEIVLLAIPINILLGRWTGLRLTEYIRFRELLRYGQ
ncbi:MAG: 7TM domain-containing protein [Candidatus Andersenbacteria bacterium]